MLAPGDWVTVERLARECITFFEQLVPRRR
jgi:hypothetical protein